MRRHSRSRRWICADRGRGRGRGLQRRPAPERRGAAGKGGGAAAAAAAAERRRRWRRQRRRRRRRVAQAGSGGGAAAAAAAAGRGRRRRGGARRRRNAGAAGSGRHGWRRRHGRNRRRRRRTTGGGRRGGRGRRGSTAGTGGAARWRGRHRRRGRAAGGAGTGGRGHGGTAGSAAARAAGPAGGAGTLARAGDLRAAPSSTATSSRPACRCSTRRRAWCAPIACTRRRPAPAPRRSRGDVVLPSQPQRGGQVVLIDRGNTALTFVNPATCAVDRQFSVKGGFNMANPHDVVIVSDSKAYVTRYGKNAAPANADGGGRRRADPRSARRHGRRPHRPVRVRVGGLSGQPRPRDHRGRQGGGDAEPLERDLYTYGDGSVVVIDPATDQVVQNLALGGLKNCEGLDYLRATKTVLVACGGSFGSTEQALESGIAVIDVSTTPATLARIISARRVPDAAGHLRRGWCALPSATSADARVHRDAGQLQPQRSRPPVPVRLRHRRDDVVRHGVAVRSREAGRRQRPPAGARRQGVHAAHPRLRRERRRRADGDVGLRRRHGQRAAAARDRLVLTRWRDAAGERSAELEPPRGDRRVRRRAAGGGGGAVRARPLGAGRRARLHGQLGAAGRLSRRRCGGRPATNGSLPGPAAPDRLDLPRRRRAAGGAGRRRDRVVGVSAYVDDPATSNCRDAYPADDPAPARGSGDDHRAGARSGLRRGLHGGRFAAPARRRGPAGRALVALRFVRGRAWTRSG